MMWAGPILIHKKSRLRLLSNFYENVSRAESTTSVMKKGTISRLTIPKFNNRKMICNEEFPII